MQSPITRSDYNTLIKKCLRQWGHRVANSIGALIIEFRDNIKDDYNFKVAFYYEGEIYLVLLVTGGFGWATRSKYRINEHAIERYDWWSKLWQTLIKIVNFTAKVGMFVCLHVPGGALALPYFEAVSLVTGVIHRAITYFMPG